MHASQLTLTTVFYLIASLLTSEEPNVSGSDHESMAFMNPWHVLLMIIETVCAEHVLLLLAWLLAFVHLQCKRTALGLSCNMSPLLQSLLSNALNPVV